MKVGTFNIRNGEADDGPNSWPNRAEIVALFIRDLGCDILGLQEVLGYQLDWIKDHVTGYRWIGVGRIDGKRMGEFAPILYRPEVVEAVGQGWFWLSETPDIPGSKSWDTACERMCTWVDFRRGDKEFRFLNTHLDHVSESARLNGARLIQERANTEAALIVGDFNCLPDDEPVLAVMDAGFTDLGEGLGTTFHDWGRTDSGRIDYILAKGMRGTARIAQAIYDGRMVSDHHAVVSEVSL